MINTPCDMDVNIMLWLGRWCLRPNDKVHDWDQMWNVWVCDEVQMWKKKLCHELWWLWFVVGEEASETLRCNKLVGFSTHNNRAEMNEVIVEKMTHAPRCCCCSWSGCPLLVTGLWFGCGLCNEAQDWIKNAVMGCNYYEYEASSEIFWCNAWLGCPLLITGQ